MSVKEVSLCEMMNSKKQELLGFVCSKLKFLQCDLQEVLAFIESVKDVVQILVSSFSSFKPFSNIYILLSFFKQYVNCLFGNEKLSKLRLMKRRGFGLFSEYFDDSLSLNAVGMAEVAPFVPHISSYIQGRKKQGLFLLSLTCLYVNEYMEHDSTFLSSTQKANLKDNLQEYFQKLSDSIEEDVMTEYVNIGKFLSIFQKKYRRYKLKLYTSQIISQLVLENCEFELFLAEMQICIKTNWNHKNYSYSTSKNISSFSALKKDLLCFEFHSFKEFWSFCSAGTLNRSSKTASIYEDMCLILKKVDQEGRRSGALNIGDILNNADILSRYIQLKAELS
jgi:hypothetical protein